MVVAAITVMSASQQVADALAEGNSPVRRMASACERLAQEQKRRRERDKEDDGTHDVGQREGVRSEKPAAAE